MRTIVAPSCAATAKSCVVPIERRAQAALGRELAPARRTSGGCPPGRSASGGIVIRPDDAHRAALEERVELVGSHAALALLAARR